MRAILPGLAHPDTIEPEKPRWTTPVLAPLSKRVRAKIRIGEVGILAILVLPAYIWVGVWMRDDLHFFVNDALARTSDAVFITVGRDPHLGAIGFFWPPLPQLIQAPFVPFLAPMGRADLAGPISSAICIALTIPVLGRLCTRLGVRRGMRFGICAAFALNPVIIYYAANGMSEACSLLFIAIAMLGFLTFIRTRTTPDLVVISVGLCGAVLTRLEAPALTAVLALVAAFEWRRWRHSLWTATLIALPPAICFLLWMAAQWVLLGSPFFYLAGGGIGPRRAIWLPNTVDHPFLAFPWALHWSLVLGPALVVVLGALIWDPLGAASRGTIGILAGAAVFLAIQINQIITHTGYGDPRYFVTCILFATIGVAWLASRQPNVVGKAWNLSLVALLLVAGITGPRSLTSGRVTHIEGECHFFDYGAAKVLPVLGRSYPQNSDDYCGRQPDLLAAWQRMDATVDRILKPGDRVLADNFSNFYAVLFTKKADQFVVRNDRDWQRTAANPIGRGVNYIVTVGDVGAGGVNVLPHAGDDVGRGIVDGSPQQWKLVAAFAGGADFAHANSTVELFKYVGPPPPAVETP
jgi:hypothetical protein